MIEKKLTKLSIQIMIPVMICSVKLVGIQRTVKVFIKQTTPSTSSITDNLNRATALRNAFRIARTQTPWKGNCLSQSLAFHWLLRKNNIASTMQIGVRTTPNFKAHAWVEFNKTPLNAYSDVRQRYQVVERYNELKLNGFS